MAEEPTKCPQIVRRHRATPGGDYRQGFVRRRLGKYDAVAPRPQPGDDHKSHLALLHQRAAVAPETGARKWRTKDEIIAAIEHLALYAGWPPAMTATQIAGKVFDEAGS